MFCYNEINSSQKIGKKIFVPNDYKSASNHNYFMWHSLWQNLGPCCIFCLWSHINTHEPSGYLQTAANSFHIQPFSFSQSLQTITKLLIHSHWHTLAQQVEVTVATWQANKNGAWTPSTVWRALFVFIIGLVISIFLQPTLNKHSKNCSSFIVMSTGLSNRHIKSNVLLCFSVGAAEQQRLPHYQQHKGHFCINRKLQCIFSCQTCTYSVTP